MLFLRITPTLPNTFINMASPIVDIPFHIFFTATLVGLIPASYITVKVIFFFNNRVGMIVWLIFGLYWIINQKSRPGASGRVLPPMTERSRVRVVVSSHCTGKGKACHWHTSPDPAQSGSSLHWVRPFNICTHMILKISCLLIRLYDFLTDKQGADKYKITMCIC